MYTFVNNLLDENILCTSVFRALQEENADLHQNLLQTVVCIESLEAELERTRDELSRVKEKYKRCGTNTTCLLD